MFYPRDPFRERRDYDPSDTSWKRTPAWAQLTALVCFGLFLTAAVLWGMPAALLVWLGSMFAISTAVGVGYLLFTKSGKDALYARPLPDNASDATRVEYAAHKRNVQYLIDSLTDPATRTLAAYHLGRLGSKRAAPELLRALNANDARHRVIVIDALRRIGDRTVIPRLREILDDDVLTVRVAAVDALAAFGEPDAVAGLAEVAVLPADAAPKGVREYALKRLVELGAAGAVERLCEASPKSVGLAHWLRLRRAVKRLTGRASGRA